MNNTCCKTPILNRLTGNCLTCNNKFYYPSFTIKELLLIPEEITKQSYLNPYGAWSVQGLWEFDKPEIYLGHIDVIAKLLAPRSYSNLVFKKVSSDKIDFIVPFSSSEEIKTTECNQTITISYAVDSNLLSEEKNEHLNFLIKAVETRPGLKIYPGEFTGSITIIFNELGSLE